MATDVADLSFISISWPLINSSIKITRFFCQELKLIFCSIQSTDAINFCLLVIRQMPTVRIHHAITHNSKLVKNTKVTLTIALMVQLVMSPSRSVKDDSSRFNNWPSGLWPFAWAWLWLNVKIINMTKQSNIVSFTLDKAFSLHFIKALTSTDFNLFCSHHTPP